MSPPLLEILLHDLSSPLLALEWSLGRVASNTSPQDQGEIAVMRESIQSMRRMIERVRLYESLRSGTASLRLVPVSVAESVSSALEPLETSLRGKRLSVDITGVDPLLKVAVDAPIFSSQILGSLISNAIAFSPAGTTITIRGRRDFSSGRAVIEVQDLGRGIPENSGFGLPITEFFAGRMGGTIAVLPFQPSRPGTIVTLSFPSI